jgi:carbon monoxide dehydrogenase subunit G
MELKGERQLPVDRAAVWAMLNDTEVLKSCVPGCESMIASGEHVYDVVMNASIGPVKARFKGRMSLLDIDPPNGYRLTFDGQSSQAGFARGEAKIELSELSPQLTQLAYTATAQIGGRLAQIGARLIDAAAAATADKFFEALAAQIAARTTGSGEHGVSLPGAAPARTGFWRWLASFFRHLLARRS